MRHIIGSVAVQGPELARWINGHHAFFPLIQALLLTHKVSMQALKDDDLERAAEGLWLSSLLLRASAVAMKLAGDMAPEAYTAVVRPTMPQGFSGMMSADHAALVRLVRNLKGYAQQPSHALRHPLLAYRLAVLETYGAHIHVCTQHVGHAASLRMEDLGGDGDASALEDLQKRRDQYLSDAGLGNQVIRKGRVVL